MLARPRLKGTRLHQVRRRRLALAAAVLAALALLGGLLAGGGSPGVKLPMAAFKAPPTPKISVSAGRKAAYANRSIAKVRAYTPYVASGSRRKREVALTFDDGPGPLTSRLARMLKRKHAAATFFVVGQQFAGFRKALRLENRLGFTIGNHTENHVLLRGHPASEQRRQIGESAARMRAAGVPYVRLFRPPGRSFDASTFKVLKKMRMLMVLWTVDSEDYTRPGTRAIVTNVLSAARPGAIVLMHDGGGDRHETLAAVPKIISKLRQRGYTLVTVPELLAGDPPPRRQRIPRGRPK